MLKSTNLSLPYIAPAQAQKHVTHNEAIRMLDSLVQMSVITQTDTTPPSSPDDGACYIIGPDALEAWAGKSKYIAAYRDGAWTFYVPQNGWVVWDRQDEALYVFHEENWKKVINNDLDVAPTQLGVNTSADGTNRLAVKSDAVLFSHDDITPGNGDMRLVLNKAALGGTASVLYQTNYSGRAEFGLSGDDDLQLKVAANGQNWTEALRVNSQTGQVSLPQTVPVSAPFNLLKDSGRFAGSPDPQGAIADDFTPPGYASP